MHTLLLAGKSISPLHIETIQGINGGTAACYVYYADFSSGRKVRTVARIEQSVDAVVQAIRDAAEQVSASASSTPYIGLGEFSHPRVIVAERGSVSGSVCPLCGYTKKVHHSNRCDCVWHKPFSGKADGVKSLHKQRIFVFADSAIYPMVSGRVRQLDSTIDGTVYNLREQDGMVLADFMFKSQGTPISRVVYLSSYYPMTLQELLQAPRHCQWALQEDDIDHAAA